MSQNERADGHGLAAFALAEQLLSKLIEKHLLSETDVLQILDEISKSSARKGLAGNDEAETEAALLTGKLAASLRRRL